MDTITPQPTEASQAAAEAVETTRRALAEAEAAHQAIDREYQEVGARRHTAGTRVAALRNRLLQERRIAETLTWADPELVRQLGEADQVLSVAEEELAGVERQVRAEIARKVARLRQEAQAEPSGPRGLASLSAVSVTAGRIDDRLQADGRVIQARETYRAARAARNDIRRQLDRVAQRTEYLASSQRRDRERAGRMQPATTKGRLDRLRGLLGLDVQAESPR